ncbi:MAG TPA: futalosine hydrolase [Chitinophagaceae bacterium]
MIPTCIVAATSPELENLALSPNQFDVLITGVGTAATVYYLTKKIQQSKPSLIIQAGIAGSFDESIPLGTTVIVQKDRFADLGVQEQNQWKDVFDMKLSEPGSAPFSNGWLINPHLRGFSNLAIQQVTSISINEVTTNIQRIHHYREKYQPNIESMEGAAFHYVCLQENIPFLQVRTISNYVGERDKSRWQMKLAIQNLGNSLQQIISNLA